MTSSTSVHIVANNMQPTNITDNYEYLYDIRECANWIANYNLERVCLQFPDELLPDSVKIALSLEKHTQRKVYILGDTTCGSCCVDEVAAEHINADGIIHFGHACLTPTLRLPVFYVLPKKSVAIESFCNRFKEFFQESTSKILLFYDVTYAHCIEHIYTELQSKYPNLIISTLNCTSSVDFTNTKKHSSVNILGRNYLVHDESTMEDYTALFLGENNKTFATLAMSISVRKWYYYEYNDICVYDPSSTPWLKRRRFLIEKLKDAEVVGIVIATLVIKDYLKALTYIKNILTKKNKKCYILSVGKLNPSKLANFPEIDAFVVIACPEHEVFDSRDFLKPMLMPYEVDLAFNSSRTFSIQYCLDFKQILPGGLDHIDFKPSVDSDMSLVSGHIRNIQENVITTDKMNSLTLASSGTVAIGKAGAQFLQDRSWRGVEQKLGETPVQPAELGRSGLPTCYDNEPLGEQTNDVPIN